jgi:hypothetical protein
MPRIMLVVSIGSPTALAMTSPSSLRLALPVEPIDLQD